jgi:hypothetical protein
MKGNHEMGIVIKKMTAADFNALTITKSHSSNGRPVSPQLQAIRALKVGEAVVLSHKGIVCTENKVGCGMNAMMGYVNKRSAGAFKVKGKHLTKGQFAVAKFEAKVVYN